MTTTDEKIQVALLELMKTKELPEITIISIADQSNVNRTTVYRHYVDKYAILQAIEEKIFKELDNSDRKRLIVGTTGSKQTGVLKILQAIDERKETIRILLSKNCDPRFYEHFITFLTEKGLKIIDSSQRFNSLSIRQKELLMQYLSSALLGLIKYWLNHPEMSVEELNSFFENLFLNGINSFTEQ